MRKLFLGLGIMVALLAGMVFLKDQLIRYAFSAGISGLLGAPVSVDKFSWNALASSVHITGLRVYNPGGFPDGIIVSIPHIDVIYDRSTIFKEKRHFLLVNIELAEMGLTRNANGKLNVDALHLVQPGSAPVPLQVDLLTLGIGKIVYKNYHRGVEPDVRVYHLNLHKSYKGVPSAHQLLALVVAEPMKATGIKSAQIYGVVMLAGVAVLPVAVAATFIGKDSVSQEIDAPFKRVYDTSLAVIRRMGKVVREDPVLGLVQANINGANVTLRLTRQGDHTRLKVGARKFMLPKLDIAGGVLYQIAEKF